MQFTGAAAAAAVASRWQEPVERKDEESEWVGVALTRYGGLAFV